MNWKNNWIGNAIIIVMILIMAWFIYQGSKRREVVTAQESTITSLRSLKNDCKDELAIATARADSLQIELDICRPKPPKPLTLEEKVNWLFENTRTTTTTRTPRSKAPAPKPDVAEKSFGSGGFSSSTIQKTTDLASDKNSGGKVSYAGNIPSGSKVGITVTSDRFRLYYLKDNYLKENGLSIPAPRLNGVDGPEFSFDSATGYWYYLDTSTLMSASVVNNWDYAMIWCVYIGRIGTWDAYLPHESMKALMKKVRGREDGAVTMQELYQMNQINSEVWTDQNKTGLLMPKSFNPISGEREKGIKRGPEDGKEYQGWDFRCRTTGEVVTEQVSSSVGTTTTR